MKMVSIGAVCLVCFAALGCDNVDEVDLPPGWESADFVKSFTGPCLWGNIEDGQSELGAVSIDGETILFVDRLSFNCVADNLDVFVKEEGESMEILIQPSEMNPGSLTRCMCTYDVRAFLGALAAKSSFSVWSRGVNSGDEPSEPHRVGDVEVSSGDAAAAGLISCDASNPCENEGMQDDDGTATWGCVHVRAYGGPFCVWNTEACTADCGTSRCVFMESYPPQTACE